MKQELNLHYVNNRSPICTCHGIRALGKVRTSPLSASTTIVSLGKTDKHDPAEEPLNPATYQGQPFVFQRSEMTDSVASHSENL